MKVNTTVNVSAEDCLKALEYELCPSGWYPPRAELVDKLQKLHTRVMEKWIVPANRCSPCGGTGMSPLGYHSQVCTDCDGTGRKDGKKS